MIWLIIDWYDALVLDSIWFCHSKKVRIPGTEDMEEYKDYCFHIKQYKCQYNFVQKLSFIMYNYVPVQYN